MEDWHRGIRDRFGNNTSVVYAVYHTLAQHGIYYLDFRQSNLKLEGLTGLSPDDEPDGDDDEL